MTFNPATKEIHVAVGTSATNLVTQANLADHIFALNFANTTAADITGFALYELDADGTTKHYVIKGATIAAAPGTLQVNQSIILATASQTLKCLADAVGIDCNGAYLEYT